MLCWIFHCDEELSHSKYNHTSHDERYRYIKEGVYTEIHSRKCNEQDNRSQSYGFPFFGLIRRNSAKCRGNILCMPRGEWIARRFYLWVSYGLKALVNYPRTGNSEGELRRLIDKSSEKSRDKYKISLALVNAPEEYYWNNKEKSFLS